MPALDSQMPKVAYADLPDVRLVGSFDPDGDIWRSPLPRASAGG